MKHNFENEYKKYVVPFAPDIESPQRITVPQDKITKIERLAKRIAEAKSIEKHHLIDNRSEYKRQYTGLLGEAAIEEYFGINIIDYSVGNSNIYNIADLNKVNLNIGVKTVEIWKFPLVHKKPFRPELICVKRKSNEIVFFGYASINTLKKYQNDNFILDNNLRNRGTKSAFYGFNELIKVDSFEDLIKIYNKNDKGVI